MTTARDLIEQRLKVGCSVREGKLHERGGAYLASYVFEEIYNALGKIDIADMVTDILRHGDEFEEPPTVAERKAAGEIKKLVLAAQRIAYKHL